MKKTILSALITLPLTAAISTSANAALANNAILNFNPGVITTNDIGTSFVNSGSYFGMDLDGDGIIGAASRTAISQADGVIVNTAQLLPVFLPGDQPSVIDFWQGSPGTHWTSSASNILTDDGAGKVTLDFSGWNMWDGIQNIFLGSGAWEAGFSDGVAQINCNIDCSFGDSYTLNYTATVPLNDPSGFGGIAYALHMEGTVGAAIPLPAAVWLFGSGLLGLAGFARCRKT